MNNLGADKTLGRKAAKRVALRLGAFAAWR
jgi:hypothetical protein